MRVRYVLLLYLFFAFLAILGEYILRIEGLVAVLTLLTLGAVLARVLIIDGHVKAASTEGLEQLRTLPAEVHSVVEISKRIDLRAPLPPLGGWAITYDFAATLLPILLERRPGLVVEASSGVSTLLTAYCLEKTRHGRVVSLDHEDTFAQKTRDALAQHGLSGLAQVVHAPLRNYTLPSGDYLWYDTSTLDPIDGPIDMLIIDGPPSSVQPLARYPALPLLGHRLSPGAVILMDDAARPDEQEIIRRWMAEFPDLTVLTFPHAKGTAILHRSAGVMMSYT